MQKMRSLSVAFFAILAAGAYAQFDGPAPLAWRWLPTSGEASSGSPTLNGDLIYVACGGRIYALDKTTGNRKWQYPAEEPIPGKFKYPPVLTGGVLIASGDNKIMYGIDPDTGASKWSFVLPEAPTGQPIVVDKAIVQALSSSQLVALDPMSGQSIWKSASGDLQTYNISDRISGQIGSSGSSILYFTQRNDLHSVDVLTRTEDAWARPIRFTSIDASAQPLVFNGAIYVASGQFLASINPLTGALIWQVPTGFQTAFAPAVSTAGVFVCSNDGMAMLFDPTTGQTTAGMPKAISLGSAPITKPSAIGDKFMVPTASGALDLIDPASGSIVWTYVIRPIGKIYEKQSGSSGQGGPGGPGGSGLGGGPGGGGFGGGQGGPGGFGGQRGGAGGSTNGNKEITEIQASGPAELDGTTLLVPARDSSLLAFDKVLGVDLTPPNVQMLFPNPGDQVAGVPPLLLYFKIRDEGSGVNEKTIQVKIDDKPYEFKYERSGNVTVQFSSSGKNRLLNDGRHLITVDATDWLGNMAHVTFSLTIDNTLPAIKLPGQPTTNPGPGGPGGPGGGGKGGGGGGLGGD
jgi:outer membrane protein assembly factor BamB